MVLIGRPPYAVDQPITTPALVISLDDDALSPATVVDRIVTWWHDAARS
ncbi:hypothetical protein SAMN05216251_13727 [Actinacidiphila alni]|uniref:Uncharacterized protein n=1 Tax=Actinacidiphila alni TaxID=380248 RepID=A0A1I2MRG7_9ACTN|nr:hypothetical protein [Actinacidiphila alni]SFF91721.1 hypothetical protein SAMN05216251_13727 [Actinacidiphila alni]